METQKSPIKDMASIALRLTITCLLAALVIGATFVLTSDAKKHNEQAKQEKVMYALLGYHDDNPVPDDVHMHHIHRYVVTENDVQSIGYLLPTDSKNSNAYAFITLDLEGNWKTQTNIQADPTKLFENSDRDAILTASLPQNIHFRYADSAIIVTQGGNRKAYLLEGKFPGFKNNIAVMVALDTNFKNLGLEIMEHEEDPGLGAEIEQNYFKKQFINKSFDRLASLNVIKKPLPDDFRDALEGKIPNAEAEQIKKEHVNDDIYALTGATISSRFVTEGVKNITSKFAYRINTLDKALKSQNIHVAF